MGLGYNVSYNGFAVCKVLKTGGRKIGNSRNFGGQPEGILGRFASPCGLRESLRQSGGNLICFFERPKAKARPRRTTADASALACRGAAILARFAAVASATCAKAFGREEEI